MSTLSTTIPSSPMPNATNTTTPQTQTPGAVEGESREAVAAALAACVDALKNRASCVQDTRIHDGGDMMPAEYHQMRKAWDGAVKALAALRATPAIDTAAQPVVKDLEWEFVSGLGEEWNALTKMGVYIASARNDGTFFWRFRGHVAGDAGSIQEAKDAAQADFERRVLACLHPASATPEAETLRAEVERLTRERDAARQAAGVETRYADAFKDRADAAEAQVASLTNERDDLVLRCAVLDEALTNKLALTQPAPEGEAEEEVSIPCERCAGNGELVTDWKRYLHAKPGDVGDEAVEDCPDCNGAGRVSLTSEADGKAEEVERPASVPSSRVAVDGKPYAPPPGAVFTVTAAQPALDGKAEEVETIAAVLFRQKQIGMSWEEAIDLDPHGNIGSTVSICRDDAAAVLVALSERST